MIGAENEAMNRVPVQQLKQRLAEILRLVEAGATFEITRHGRVVARLASPLDTPHLHRGARVGEAGDWLTMPGLGLGGDALRILLEDRAGEDR